MSCNPPSFAMNFRERKALAKGDAEVCPYCERDADCCACECEGCGKPPVECGGDCPELMEDDDVGP